MWLHDVLRRFRAPGWLLVLNSVWCAGIIYSTLATRQHVIIDVMGGLILGAVMAQYALRKQAKSTVP
jgi:membrane-associated phospholipid phosphatase